MDRLDWDKLPRLTRADVQAIPRPKTPADYVECYRANLREARDNLARAQARFRIARDQHLITERAPPDSGFMFADGAAARIYADVVRWKSDLDHWPMRKVEAEQEMRGAAVREVGADDDDPAPAVVITEEEKANRVRELAEQLAMRMGEKDDDDLAF